MTKLEQAARQALEALSKQPVTNHGNWILVTEAITALQEALAEQENQEPFQVGFLIDGIVHLDDDYKTGVWPLYVAPVRTKDLTDDEVMQTYTNFNLNELGEQSFMIGFARAVIAADREKNK